MVNKTIPFYQSMIVTLIVFIFLLLGMVALVLYHVFHRPLPVFYAYTPNGNSMNLHAFDEPSLQSNTILRWARKAAVASYSFDFVNFKKQAQMAARYFTKNGWEDYLNSLNPLLIDIAAKQIFVNSVVSGPPVISNQGQIPGKEYLWRVQIPFLVTYQSAEEVSKQKYFVVMTIGKIPTTVDPMGIGIEQFVMR